MDRRDEVEGLKKSYASKSQGLQKSLNAGLAVETSDEWISGFFSLFPALFR